MESINSLSAAYFFGNWPGGNGAGGTIIFNKLQAMNKIRYRLATKSRISAITREGGD